MNKPKSEIPSTMCKVLIRIKFFAMLAFIAIHSSNSIAQNNNEYECLIEPAIELSLSSPVAGLIESIGVDRGSRVKRGQILVQLQATAELATVELARAKLEFGERKVARTKELFAENFTSEYSVDEAVTEARLAAVELEQAQTILSQKTLHSPISGLVLERLVQVGEFVTDDEILKIAQLNPLHIEVIIPVEHIDSVKKGMQAMVFPQKPVGGEYTAKVITVDKVLDAASGTFGVRLELPNPKNALPAGLRCLVRFPDA